MAILWPVLRNFAEAFPDKEVVFVSRKNFAPLFQNIPNLIFIGLDMKDYKGIIGLWKLFIFLSKSGPFEAILDMHDVLRTQIVRTFLWFTGNKIAIIDKGRTEKKALTRRNNKKLLLVKSTSDRYLEVFAKAGYSFSISEHAMYFEPEPSATKAALELLKSKPNGKYHIGFAPFAAHFLKILPDRHSKKIIEILVHDGKSNIYLFGSKAEKTKMEALAQGLNGVFIMTDLTNGLTSEMGVISKLDLMITMDSANMHLAALCGTPLLSIWGPTHSYTGFTPYQQSETGVYGLGNLSCRPCSVYGNKACYRKDHACMEQIEPQEIVDLVYKRISKNLLRVQNPQ
ncbi:MAG: glycosyltransferase family 9 protein [Bacteroidota bacterium]|nr:glycosyltransferase family 9 protein [Bacteroidota bacterium]